MNRRHLKVFVVAALVGAIAMWAWLSRSPHAYQPLSPNNLKENVAKWKTQGPKNYRMHVEVSGAANGKYEIIVKDSKVVSMTNNSGEAANASAKGFWSIEGMLAFLKQELRNREKPAATYGIIDKNKVYLDVNFDKALGYPKWFRRQVFGKSANIEWTVKQFQTQGL